MRDDWLQRPYYRDGRSSTASRAATGAAVGAVAGGVLGAVVPGVSTVGGAIAGGIAGAVIGAVVNGRQYYRDTRGYCYYVDRNGQPIYDNSTFAANRTAGRGGRGCPSSLHGGP